MEKHVTLVVALHIGYSAFQILGGLIAFTFIVGGGLLAILVAGLASLEAELTVDEAKLVLIDTLELEYIDSAAFSELERILDPAQSRGAVRFIGPGPGLSRWLNLYDPPPELPFFASISGILLACPIGRGLLYPLIPPALTS